MRKVLVVLSFSYFIFSCSVFKKKNKEGDQLAKVYCASCHQVPDPGQLDKKTWLFGVLPKMGPRLGISSYQGYPYEVNRNAPGLPKGYYPDSAALTIDEWGMIMNYFYEAAPDSLDHHYPPIEVNADLFDVKMPPVSIESPPVTCLVKIDPINHGIYTAHGAMLKLKSFDQELNKIDETTTKTVVVGLALKQNKDSLNQSGFLLNMGALNPYDIKHGSLQKISFDRNLKIDLNEITVEEGMPRPVHISAGDIDGDKKEDVVVCGFGNFVGELFWLKNTGDNKYEKKSLRNLPGAIQTILVDVNHDSRMDILALMAQGDEGIFLYQQQPDGAFEEKRILRFSPVAGSISFDLADFNKDGFPDLIYTSGDNADYSQILKPYHGVYLFINDGKWNFKQEYFFPINGCFKAVAKDFDLDGDTDIAAISYFSDYKNRPKESFVYLKNNGNLNFVAQTIKEYAIGRWLTMDVNDLDGDGDQDIVLGNMSVGPSNFAPNADWRKGPEFILLLNKTR